MVPTFIAVARDWGVHSAMIRFKVQYRVENREFRSIFISGIISKIVLGLMLSAASFSFAEISCKSSRPEITLLIQVASFIVLAGELSNIVMTVFVGVDRCI